MLLSYILRITVSKVFMKSTISESDADHAGD